MMESFNTDFNAAGVSGPQDLSKGFAKDFGEREARQWADLWSSVVRVLEDSPAKNHIHWIQPLRIEEISTTPSGLKARISSINDFSADWVRDNLRKKIEEAFSQVTGNNCEAVIEVRKDVGIEATHESTFHVQAPAPISAPAASPPGIIVQSSHRSTVDQPDPRYTFESFVVGASNQFAHASALAVAEQPAKQYNPFFIYSPPGLGKTHLLHAIGNRWLQKNPNGRVAYLSAEKFVNELIDSLQHKRMAHFRAKYRDSFDIILMDDIQFIAGKNTSEEEFFHTFNALHSSKRQIVLTSDRPPKEIEKLEERVRTRFEWGLVADIGMPEIETRIAILKSKAERDDIYLPDDVATFIASFVKSNVRELEGVLIRLQAQASLTGAEISLEMAKHELKTAIPEESTHYTVESIQGAVARHFHIKVQDLRSTSKARKVALPRQIAMYLMRKYTELGLVEIGEYFGGKNHTTIMYACEKIEAELETNGEIREAVESIQNLL